MPLSPGQILDNRYRVVKLLGQGGFGAVYRVWDTRLDRPRALKENLDTSPEAQRQFKREAQILSDLSHPNLPRVIDHFIVPGQGQYLVMDYVEGEDLQEMLQRVGGPLPEAQVLDWIGQVSDALEYLHSQSPPIIHRDVKPANIKITPDGKAMLVDFGIAKVYDPQLRTTIGARAVTPGYSPNEQYLSSGQTDARTDVYALGATLYCLLTGKAPPEAPERNMGVVVPSPRSLYLCVSFKVEDAITRSLEMQPEKRYQSIAGFKSALTKNETVEIGRIYTGPVVKTTRDGAVIEILPNVEGFVHVSQHETNQIKKVEDIVKTGVDLTVMVIGIDSTGKIRLSRVAVLEGLTLEEAIRRDKRQSGTNWLERFIK